MTTDFNGSYLDGLFHGLLEHLDGLYFPDFFQRRNFDVLKMVQKEKQTV